MSRTKKPIEENITNIVYTRTYGGLSFSATCNDRIMPWNEILRLESLFIRCGKDNKKFFNEVKKLYKNLKLTICINGEIDLYEDY